MDTDIIFTAICAMAVLIMAVYYTSRKRRLRCILSGTLTGLVALFLINKYGVFIGADIPVNIFNLSGSIILGVPFVICLAVLEFL